MTASSYRAEPDRFADKPLSITASVNAGLSVTFPNGARFLIDALPGKKLETFSFLDREKWARLQVHPAFQDPDLIFFSHCHEDHYYAPYAKVLHQKAPQAPLVLPEQEFPDQFLLERPTVRVNYKGIEIFFFRSVHEGEIFADVPHYGCILEYSGFRILYSGDSMLGSEELREAIRHRPIDLAIMNFPWVTLGRGRDFIQNVIRPQHLLINHIPLAEDDLLHFRSALKTAAAKLDIPDIRMLLDPFQEEAYTLPR